MLNLVLGVVTLLNALWRYLDDRQRAEAARKLIEADNLKADLEAINRANTARDAVVRDIRDHPDRVRAPDEFTRP